MLAFALAYTVLPGLLTDTKTPKIADTSLTDTVWYKICTASSDNWLKKRKLVFISALVISAISVAGTLLIKTNYFLLEIRKRVQWDKTMNTLIKNLWGFVPLKWQLLLRIRTKQFMITRYWMKWIKWKTFWSQIWIKKMFFIGRSCQICQPHSAWRSGAILCNAG